MGPGCGLARAGRPDGAYGVGDRRKPVAQRPHCIGGWSRLRAHLGNLR